MKEISILVCMVVSITMQAYEPKEEFDFKENGICYNIISEEDKTVETTTGDTNDVQPPIGDFNNYPPASWWQGGTYEGSVDIPLSVVHDGVEYKVVAIGDGTFVRCRRLVSVSIPEGIETIGDAAFSLCESLNEIQIPESVTSFGNNAFAACSKLNDFYFPSGVKIIPSGCFQNVGTPAYASNAAIYINLHQYENIEQIGDYAFDLAVIKSFDFSITKITGCDKVGNNIFTDSYIQEIALPISWDDSEYSVLLNKLCDGGLPEELEKLVLNREEPPTVDNVQTLELPEELYSQVTLEVPSESIDDYRNAPFWGRFNNIKALGIEDIRQKDKSASVYYTTDGVLLHSEPEHGIYIRRHGNKVEKVIL